MEWTTLKGVNDLQKVFQFHKLRPAMHGIHSSYSVLIAVAGKNNMQTGI